MMDDLLDIINQYASAIRELDDCHERCGPESGYFCYDQSQTVDRIRQRFTEKLNEIIDQRVAEVMQRVTP
jgi:hypothetical protein